MARWGHCVTQTPGAGFAGQPPAGPCAAFCAIARATSCRAHHPAALLRVGSKVQLSEASRRRVALGGWRRSRFCARGAWLSNDTRGLHGSVHAMCKRRPHTQTLRQRLQLLDPTCDWERDATDAVADAWSLVGATHVKPRQTVVALVFEQHVSCKNLLNCKMARFLMLDVRLAQRGRHAGSAQGFLCLVMCSHHMNMCAHAHR